MYSVRLSLVSILLFSSATASAAEGQLSASNFIGLSPVGAAGFLRLNVGSYEIFYERRLVPHHSLRLAFDFIHVHQSAVEDQSHQWTFGGSLTYRYSPREGEGVFGGLRLGLRRGFGHYGFPDAADHLKLVNRQLSVIPQLGYRWFLSRSVSVIAHAGVGYGPYVVEDRDGKVQPNHPAIRFSRDALAVSPIVIDSELSIAFAF